jgi:cobalt-zinc-cadmium efflux system outer membrane protein
MRLHLLHPISAFRAHSCRELLVALVCASAAAHAAQAQTSPAPGLPLTLRALLDSVRASHPLVRAAESRVRAAEGSRVTAGAFANPILSYQVDQTPFPGGRPLPGMEREAMTTVTLPLEPLYQRRPRLARANAEVRATAADAAAIRQRMGLDAATAYYRTATAQVQIATTRDLVSWLDTLVTYNSSRVKEGVAAEADLIRSGLERDRMLAEAAMQDAELAQARAALGAFLSPAQLTNILPVVAVDESPLALPPSPRPTANAGVPGAIAARAPALSIDARPEVRAARERVAASKAGVGAERSMLIRQLGATIGTMQTGRSTSMVAGVSVPVPLFDSNRGEVQRAGAERDAAVFEMAAQERSAMAELRGAYEAAHILTERAATLARPDSGSFLARAEESRRIALGAYREGAVPLFQVIDAARSWADVRMTYYRTLFAQHQSVLALLVAQGVDLFAAVPATILAPTSGTDTSRGEQ